MKFELLSSFSPTGDQPQAIEQLVNGINENTPSQVLQGVTGSGKTFTIANVIKQINRPTLVLSHNKTLAAQLYSEFKAFFPNNAVEYFVSYYDYYQPEAYIAQTNTYIEKDLQINDELEKLRLSTTSALLSSREDVIVVSSVSCLYGIGNPEDFNDGTITIKVGDIIDRNLFLLKLTDSLYSRNEIEFSRGKFRVKGDVIDVYMAYGDYAYRIYFFDNEVESLEIIDPISGRRIEKKESIIIYPAGNFITNKKNFSTALTEIQQDMFKRRDFFLEVNRPLEAKRIEERVNYDLEMLKELNYCSGIENYSRYFDRRNPGSRPFCLLDYFPKDFLMVIDESHVTVPQIRAMYGGDRSRKENLVEYGFRLPSAFDNRPLRFEEFETMLNQTIYISATPSDYEIEKADGVIVEQIIRPTGLLDPIIEIHPQKTQVDDLLEEIAIVVEKKERVLVTTLTKRMAEELSRYLTNLGVRNKYIHSDIETLERVEIIQDLRLGVFDVLIGVNLLREGLDIPEVALVAILDADKEGFLRSDKAIIQTIGRASRNEHSKAILYADKITGSMQRAMDVNRRNREKQIKYNEDNNITPSQIKKNIANDLTNKYDEKTINIIPKIEIETKTFRSEKERMKTINNLRKLMDKAVKELDFLVAAQYRDEIERIKNK
ncbi:MAG: excinuclease ABC subunit UvrB [Bacteroidales bacterium]|jgi:excinuclease ABC subunit B|nr:excinuclease ABC subunit UvrB [Bacteroidales bacterium]